MAIDYLGQTFTPLTAIDNSLILLGELNALLIANNVKDSEGNQVAFKVNIASPIWLIILALGATITAFQWLVQGAGNSTSITNCSDQQLLNIAEIAGTERLPGTATILFVTVTAGPSGAVITPSDTLPYGLTASFEPITTTTLGANATVIIETRSTAVGPVYVYPGEITAFAVTPTGVVSVTNAASSIPGTAVESYSALRKRLQGGGQLRSSIDETIVSISALGGINYCNVYFNPSLTVVLTLPGGITISPRHARIFVYGSSDLLAYTYFQNMTAETEGTESQNYRSLSGQDIEVLYNVATLRNIHIKVVILAGTGQTNWLTEAQRLLLAASGTRSIGVNYTQQYLLNYLDNFPYAEIIGLYVSTDGITWSDSTDIYGEEIGIIDTADIVSEEKVV